MAFGVCGLYNGIIRSSKRKDAGDATAAHKVFEEIVHPHGDEFIGGLRLSN